MSENLKELSNIASQLYYLSNFDNDIEWSEWIEEDEANFPVRLRLWEDEYSLQIGLSDFDTDHRGFWGSGYLYQGMSEQECFDLLLTMQEEIFEQSAVQI